MSIKLGVKFMTKYHLSHSITLVDSPGGGPRVANSDFETKTTVFKVIMQSCNSLIIKLSNAAGIHFDI
jgi:hypothetical protein